MFKDYKPIACADYDIYEIAIMQRRLLKLKWQSQAGEIKQETVEPVSLQIKDGAEYLTIESQHEGQLDIRLDKILQAQFIDSEK